MNVNQEQFKELIKDKELVVAKFGANWCGPCKTMKPVMYELAEKNSQIENLAVVEIDVDENRDISIELNIRSIPAILFMKNGVEIERFIGFKSKDEIQNKIDSILS